MAIMTIANQSTKGWVGLCLLLLIGGGMCIFLIGNLIYDYYQRELKPRKIAKEKRKEKNNDKVNLDNPKDWEVK